ncbi:sugar porter family MFS transporter [uncultured Shewanella sp.]|uniref:sugar porter family MFS transporter n=1 Tax=uncultured Shewanella sp. TaxID=173975 RepID=UPI0026088E92|nr:sugar porter family MFS transporter [uncultured Shewanella sp.]
MSHSNEKVFFITFICFIAAIGSFLFGFYTGVINGTLGGLASAFDSHYMGLSVNVASMLIGCAIGAFFAGHLADLFGRRIILIVISILFIVSSLGAGFATTSSWFIAFRILGGMGVGAASVIVPMYIAEVAPARYRGSLGAIQQVAVILGLFIAFMSNYVLVNVAGGVSHPFWFEYETWRWMFWMELIPSFVFLLGLLLIPETPRYLVLSGQHQKAVAVLTRLYGQFIGEARYIEISLTLSESHLPRFSDLKNKQTGKLYKVVWIGLGLALFQQLTGINVIFYYGVVFWKAAGFSELDALLINVIVGGICLVASIFTLLLIDKVGRKIFLMMGSIGMTASLAVMVGVFYHTSKALSGVLILGDLDWVVLIAANAYVFFFSLSWGPVMWVLLGEMFPNPIRGSALAVTGVALWIANLLTVMTFPIILSQSGLMIAYGIYGGMALLSILFVYQYVYETKGKELEAMSY